MLQRHQLPTPLPSLPASDINWVSMSGRTVSVSTGRSWNVGRRRAWRHAYHVPSKLPLGVVNALLRPRKVSLHAVFGRTSSRSTHRTSPQRVRGNGVPMRLVLHRQMDMGHAIRYVVRSGEGKCRHTSSCAVALHVSACFFFVMGGPLVHHRW